MWRSPLCSGLRELEVDWSLDDLVRAHLTLDVEDDLAAAVDERAQAESRKHGGSA